MFILSFCSSVVVVFFPGIKKASTAVIIRTWVFIFLIFYIFFVVERQLASLSLWIQSSRLGLDSTVGRQQESNKHCVSFPSAHSLPCSFAHNAVPALCHLPLQEDKHVPRVEYIVYPSLWMSCVAACWLGIIPVSHSQQCFQSVHSAFIRWPSSVPNVM